MAFKHHTEWKKGCESASDKLCLAEVEFPFVSSQKDRAKDCACKYGGRYRDIIELRYRGGCLSTGWWVDVKQQDICRRQLTFC